MKTPFAFCCLLCFTAFLGKAEPYYSFKNFDGISSELCVRDLVQHSNGLLWIGAESGLYSFDGYHLSAHPYLDDQGKRVGGLGSFNCLLDKGDSLMIGCNNGLLSFRFDQYTFHRLHYAQGEAVRGILEADGRLWVATDRQLYCDGKRIEPSISDIFGLGSDGKRLFIGTRSKLLCYSINEERIETLLPLRYASCFLAKNDSLWVGTTRQLCLYRFQDSLQLMQSYEVPVAKSICYDREGVLCVGTDNGLLRFFPNGTRHHILHDARQTHSLAGDAVWTLMNDRDGNLWAGTNVGLSMLPNYQRFHSIELPRLTGESMGNQLFCVFRDNQQRAWLGGGNGLICVDNLEAIDSQEPQCRWYRMGSPSFRIPHNRIRCIMQDSRGRIWAGSDGGLLLYQESRQQFLTLRIKEDPDNWIYYLRETGDNEYNVTTYTASYRVQFDSCQQQLQVKSLAKREDLSSVYRAEQRLLASFGLDKQFYSAYRHEASGQVLLGGNDCVGMLYSQVPYQAAEVRFTGIRRANQAIVPWQLNRRRELVLPPDEKVIDLMFSDFDYARQWLGAYDYRIGNSQWIPLAADAYRISLSNPSYGKHRIQLRHRGDSQALCEVSLRVLRPWYASVPAMFAYVLLGVGVALLLFEQRRRRLQIQSAQHKEAALISENKRLTSQLKITSSSQEETLTEDEQVMRHLRSIIEEHLSNSDFDVDMLSELSGLHSKQVYRKIKQFSGLTTVAYIRDVRLEKAAHLLSKGGLTVSEVMFSVGFTNPSYFSKSFAKKFGVTPSDYSRSNR